MSDSDDLLGKADAFLKRYHPSGAAVEGDVPVLTEVIAESSTIPAEPSPGTPGQGNSTNIELLELEQRLKQSILDAIGPHIERLIREAVARAVELEIARVRGPSRDP